MYKKYMECMKWNIYTLLAPLWLSISFIRKKNFKFKPKFEGELYIEIKFELGLKAASSLIRN